MAHPVSQDVLSAREIIDLELQVALEELERLCDITPDQEAALRRLAGEALGAPVADDADPDDAVSAEDVAGRIPIHSTLWWSEASSAVLDSDQLETWEKATKDRARRRREAQAARYVAAVQRHLWLDSEQRDALQGAILSRSPNPANTEKLLASSFRSIKFSIDLTLAEAVSSIRSSDLDGLITPRQMALFEHLRREVLEPNAQIRELMNGAGRDSTLPVSGEERQMLDESVAQVRLESELHHVAAPNVLEPDLKRKLELMARTIQARQRQAPKAPDMSNRSTSWRKPRLGDPADPNYYAPRVVWRHDNPGLGPDDVFYADPAWAMTLERLLPPELAQSYRAKEQEHRLYRLEAIADGAISAIDVRLLLSSSQRDDLREALVERLTIADNEHVEWFGEHGFRSKAPDARSRIAGYLLLSERQADEILTAPQSKLWKQLRHAELRDALGGSVLQAVGAFTFEISGNSIELSFRVTPE